MTVASSCECRPVPAEGTLFHFTKYVWRELDDILLYHAIVISKRSFRSIETKLVSCIIKFSRLSPTQGSSSQAFVKDLAQRETLRPLSRWDEKNQVTINVAPKNPCSSPFSPLPPK